MKQWLIDLGLDVTKETAKAISIRNPYGDENSRPIRLEGAIYEQNFRFGAEGDSLTAEASERYRREARKRYRENLQRYAEQIDGKIREFQQKYQQRDAELEKAGHASHERAKDPNLDQQGGVEKSAERSHERDYRADYNRQEDVAESTYRSNHRNSGSLPEASRELRGDLARVEPLTRRYSAPSDFEKALITSVWPLIILVGVLVMSSIATGLYLNYQKNQLSRMNQQIEDLRVRGATLNLLTCDKQLCVQIDPKAPHYEGNYRVIVEK